MYFLIVFTILQFSWISALPETVSYKCPNNLTDIDLYIDLQLFLTKTQYVYQNLEVKCDYNKKLKLDYLLFPNLNLIDSLKVLGFSLTINGHFLRNLKYVKSVAITNCEIDFIDGNAFQSFLVLTKLDLSNNNMKMINSDYFGRVKYLDLSSNSITMLSNQVYKDLSKKVVKSIDLRRNPISCDCVNKWIVLLNFSPAKLLLDPMDKCEISRLYECYSNQALKLSIVKFTNRNITKMAFSTVNLNCPLRISDPINQQLIWISPHQEMFSGNNGTKLINTTMNNVAFYIGPLLHESKISVDSASNDLKIIYFRGYFRGKWICRIVSRAGDKTETIIILNISTNLYEMFLFTVIVGFGAAGAFLCIAIAIGLTRYMKETHCCRKNIDYDNSLLFEKRFVNTVIPVPYEEEDVEVEYEEDDDDNNDEDNFNENSAKFDKDQSYGCEKPLNISRIRHESYNNNDVQLIFRDEKLAEEYVKILEELKQASETGDEKFKDRLSVLRNRFSIDLEKMRFEFKRGMESLKSNSSAAAHKLRKSVGQMRNHMRSFTEFCGTSSNMAQSISIIILPQNHHHGPCNSVNCGPHSHNNSASTTNDESRGAAGGPDDLTNQYLSQSPSNFNDLESSGATTADFNHHNNNSSYPADPLQNSNTYPCCDSYEKAQRERKVFRFFEMPFNN